MGALAATDAGRLAALRAGEEREFAQLVEDLGPRMLDLARAYVDGSAVAEEAVQEAWIVVLRSLDRFQGRSALSTWILGIVVNVARGRGVREARSRPFSSIGADEPRGWRGHWAIAPAPWPDRALETAEAERLIRRAIAGLPETQQAVITLRDLVGCTPGETCDALGITDANQRVLLHRARREVRAAVEAATSDRATHGRGPSPAPLRGRSSHTRSRSSIPSTAVPAV